jgi:hypothetical protein
LSFGSIELEFDNNDDEDDDVVGLCFSGTSICKGICSDISIVGGRGCFN